MIRIKNQTLHKIKSCFSILYNNHKVCNYNWRWDFCYYCHRVKMGNNYESKGILPDSRSQLTGIFWCSKNRQDYCHPQMFSFDWMIVPKFLMHAHSIC